MNSKCKVCKRKFPVDLIQPMTTADRSGIRSVLMCPLCALLERNVQAGLPLDEPFSGTMANEMWLRAKAYVTKGV